MAAPEIPALYPRLNDFEELVQELDPDGQFRNGYLTRTLGIRP